MKLRLHLKTKITLTGVILTILPLVALGPVVL